MRIDDLLAALKPEHFAGGRVPARTTVADRLAGVGLSRDFIEAVADVCSGDVASRNRKMQQVSSLKAALADRGGTGAAQAGAAVPDADLVRVQHRSLEVSDKLMRAMERATELERERNSANHMVVLLLTMVDKLQRDIATLVRERDRIRSIAPEQQKVLARLAHSEQQRATAQSELVRARAERHRADQLAQDAAERVRELSEELARLRVGEGRSEQAEGAVGPAVLPALPPDRLGAGSDDIDQALAKAARHLDDGADRLDRLAGELRLDNPPDSQLTSTDASDNPTVIRPSGEPRSDSGTLTSAALIERVGALRYRGEDDQADLLLSAEGSARPLPALVEVIAALRAAKRDTDASQIVTSVGAHRTATQICKAVGLLREAGLAADAYQVFAAAGRLRPATSVQALLSMTTEPDTAWLMSAICRERPVDELPPLIELLRNNQRHNDSEQIHEAFLARKQKAARTGSAEPPEFKPLNLADTQDDEKDTDEDFIVSVDLIGKFNAEPAMRHYALAGRLPRGNEPAPTTIVTTTAEPAHLAELLPEHRSICDLCVRPMSVSQIALKLGLPVGVTQILVADLAVAGVVALANNKAAHTG